MNKKFLFSILITISLTFTLTGCAKMSNTTSEQSTEVIDTTTDNQSNESVENEENEFIGKWNTVEAANEETGESTKNLRDVFGSSFEQFGSYLELKDDGTFVDAIIPVTDGSKSTTGKYTIKRDYLKIGDAYVFLYYSDGQEKNIQKIFLDESGEPYLVLDGFVNGYQLYLKR